MNVLDIKPGVKWLGVQDHEIRVFDIIMVTEFGTSYNSYLIQGTEKTALVETVKVKFWDSYLAKLQETVDLKSIDYVIVDHTEPDHAGSLEKLLELIPDVTIVGSPVALKYLKAITNREFKAMPVNAKSTLDLGGKTLSFIPAPLLHWPDSMYTYLHEDKVLFTCDSFGAHYAFDEVLLSKVQDRTDYYSALKYYYDCIMGPFKSSMTSAIQKIEHLDLDVICNGHGPVLDVNPREIVELCKEWSVETNPNSGRSVVVPYISVYGYTELMAREIKRSIEDTGEGIEVTLFDLTACELSEVLDKIYWADGLLFGSPTINADTLPPIWNLLSHLNPIVHGKKLAGVFGSYGWSGEAIKNIEARLGQLRLKVVPNLRTVFKPSEDELTEAYEYGRRFAQELVNPGTGFPVEAEAEAVV
ncbi:FprA family A-type flavoprotein [Gorillibacterium sp. CAU 1737]|uniref:FprA family A-type flavoprotein n=1 Tax=Gorillibacterium sp. CAU 1737 TaxID=3140362 RepID=UPI003260FE41